MVKIGWCSAPFCRPGALGAIVRGVPKNTKLQEVRGRRFTDQQRGDAFSRCDSLLRTLTPPKSRFFPMVSVLGDLTSGG